MQTTIGQRIRQKRKEYKWTQQELAKKLKDVSHVAISQWESNTTKPNAENLYELSQIFKCDFGWLLKGKGEQTNVAVVEELDTEKIPILTLEQLKFWDVTHPINKNEGEYIMTNIKSSEHTFAFRIHDDSMSPNFFSGDIVVIDPQIRPTPGEFVIARIGQDVLFRKYQVESYSDGKTEVFSLSPLNTDFPPFSSSQHEIQLIGTMIEHRIYRRKR